MLAHNNNCIVTILGYCKQFGPARLTAAVAEVDDAPESRTAIEATVQAMRDPELNALMREMLPMFRGLLTDRLALAVLEASA